MKELVIEGRVFQDLELFGKTVGLGKKHLRDMCGGSSRVKPVLAPATTRIGRRWMIDVDRGMAILSQAPSLIPSDTKADSFDDLAGL